ncbi:MAG: GNAT family N-acetyltransferase [Frankiaceae bacterium]
MNRCAVVVRVAVPADVPALVTLWAQLRELGGGARLPRSAGAAAMAGAEERLAACLAEPACRVVVAEYDRQVVGMAILALSRIGQLLDTVAVELHHVVVADGYRRRGVGRALVATGVSWAEELGADEVVAGVYPNLREANRFYARLGFAPLLVRRVAPTAGLKRRLAAIDRRPRVERVRRRALAPRPGRVAALPVRLVHADDAALAAAAAAARPARARPAALGELP